MKLIKLINIYYRNILINYWYKTELNFFLWIFYPIEFVYLLIILLRKILYKYNIFKTYKFNTPIMVIGNLTVGGTGKTPVVMYIVNYLKNNGFKPAIVMRGYKSKCMDSHVVPKNSDSGIYGDEPVLMANNVNCPVIIGKNRVKSVEFLLKNLDVNVIVCDDGLQHYSLARDLEVVMIDGERGFGNMHCLPLGPLRENIAKLNTVNLIIFNNQMFCSNKNKIQLDYLYNNKINNQYTINLIPEKIYNLLNPKIIKDPKDFSFVHAVSGIGNNQKFFNLLNNLGIQTINHNFPDHYQYQEEDLCFNDNLPVIMTEKDAVKCVKFAKNNFWVQKVTVRFNLEQQFNEYLIKFLIDYYKNSTN